MPHNDSLFRKSNKKILRRIITILMIMILIKLIIIIKIIVITAKVLHGITYNSVLFRVTSTRRRVMY